MNAATGNSFNAADIEGRSGDEPVDGGVIADLPGTVIAESEHGAGLSHGELAPEQTEQTVQEGEEPARSFQIIFLSCKKRWPLSHRAHSGRQQGAAFGIDTHLSSLRPGSKDDMPDSIAAFGRPNRTPLGDVPQTGEPGTRYGGHLLRGRSGDEVRLV